MQAYPACMTSLYIYIYIYIYIYAEVCVYTSELNTLIGMCLASLWNLFFFKSTLGSLLKFCTNVQQYALLCRELIASFSSCSSSSSSGFTNNGEQLMFFFLLLEGNISINAFYKDENIWVKIGTLLGVSVIHSLPDIYLKWFMNVGSKKRNWYWYWL